MTPGRRHLWLARVVLCRVAEPRRSEWLADLEEDWRARRDRVGVVRADAWFIVELMSLARADRGRPTTTRGARFRPRFVDGKLAEAAPVSVRYPLGP